MLELKEIVITTQWLKGVVAQCGSTVWTLRS